MNDRFITISSPDKKLSLELCPSAGGIITAFRLGETDLFRAYDRDLPLDPLNSANFPMVPFCNRISHGKLNFRGETLDVGPIWTTEPHHLHGYGWTHPWTVKELTANRTVLSLKKDKRKDTPYAFEAEQAFILEDGVLLADITVTNRAGRALPFGMGHHPYFPRTDRTVFKARLPKVWTSNKMVPQELIDTPARWDFSEGRVLAESNFQPEAGYDGTALLDHCFQGWDGHAEIIQPDFGTKVTMTADPLFDSFLVFIPAPGNDFFCAEAVSNVTDAFNLMDKGQPDTGAVILEDNESFSGRTRFAVSKLT